MMPTLVSIQVGLPKKQGVVGSDAVMERPFRSGIFKAAVQGAVWLGKLNLAGDGQADLKNHGGPERAALGYSAEHYPTWRAELGMSDLPYGGFGENLTISGLDEETVCIGDIYQIGGEAQVQVTQPRQPCWKLDRRWGIENLNRLVYEKAWGGWYHRVLREASIEAGMTMKRIERPFPQFSVRDVYALMNKWIADPQAVEQLAECAALSQGWREVFAERVARRK
jgi:MOSC domain-containing protein YiiM